MAAESRAPQITAVNLTFVVLSWISTLLRVYCRGWVIKAFAADDWLAVISQCFFTVYLSNALVGAHYGSGQHLKNIHPGNIPKAMKPWWTCEITYVLSNMALKASIAIFLLRLCTHKYHKVIILVVTAITEVYSFTFFVLFILQCRPTSLFWLQYTENPPRGSCWDPTIISKCFIVYSVISCWTDWTLSILPMFLVAKLQMNRRMKISVMFVLAAGTFASTATIVRLPYLRTLTEFNDFLYATTDVAIWSTVETGLGITASGLATLRPLFRSFFGTTRDKSYGTSGGTRQHTNNSRAKETYSRGGADNFELDDEDEPQMGITTVIKRATNSSRHDLESNNYGVDGRSEISDYAAGDDGCNGSQVNLADRNKESDVGQGWHITVQKSVVQTTHSRTPST